MSTPYPASLIAYAFIKKGIGEGLPVTQMKLQKMVYIAHGVFMAINNSSPLIQEEFEAWQFGPVISNIYQQYRAFGSNQIVYSDPELEAAYENLKQDNRAFKAIEYTWNITKNLSAYTLSNWTHLSGSPWANAYKAGYSHIPIDNLEISNFFKKVLNQANGRAANPAT